MIGYDWKRYRTEAVIGALVLDEILSPKWAATPNAIVMPGCKKRWIGHEKNHLAVSIFLAPVVLSRSIIDELLQQIIRVLWERKLLQDLRGIETVINTIKPGEIEGHRIVRISVPTDAACSAVRACGINFLLSPQHKGVLVTWYDDDEVSD